MWKPTKIGQVIAQRRFHFDGRGGRRAVVVRFGRPVRAPRAVARDPWWCPVEVEGLGVSAVRALAGEDSLQALILALEFATNELPLQAADVGGRLEWLGERERLVFADTRARGLLGRGLQNMAEGLIEALAVLESGGTRRSSTNGLVSELAALIASGGQSKDSKAKRRPPNEALQPPSRLGRSAKSPRRPGGARG